MSSINFPEKSNPFFTEDDDDYSFGARGGYGAAGSSRVPPGRVDQLQQMKENSMNNTLESTQRAMASIYDSERMGIATAEELVHQGEQLDNVERTVDKINQDTKTSQRHLNNIKSIFGGFKNWWSGGEKKNEKQEVEEKPVPKASQQLRDAIAEDRAINPHRRSEDGHGFYDDDQDLDSKFLSGGSSGKSGMSQGSRGFGAEQGAGSSPYAQTSYQTQEHISGFKEYDQQLDQNLDVMAGGMARLKGLALGLGGEIERQNEQLERISVGVGKADTTLADQNKQMRRILDK